MQGWVSTRACARERVGPGAAGVGERGTGAPSSSGVSLAGKGLSVQLSGEILGWLGGVEAGVQLDLHFINSTNTLWVSGVCISEVFSGLVNPHPHLLCFSPIPFGLLFPTSFFLSLPRNWSTFPQSCNLISRLLCLL